MSYREEGVCLVSMDSLEGWEIWYVSIQLKCTHIHTFLSVRADLEDQDLMGYQDTLAFKLVISCEEQI